MNPATDPLAFLQRATSLIVQRDLQGDRDMSGRQLAILLHLVKRDGPPPSIVDIAAWFNLSKPATTRNVDRLADVIGFVSRTPSPADRRKVEVRITEAGAAYVADLIRELQDAP